MRSISGRASLAMLIFKPARLSALSPSESWAVRCGSIRQSEVTAGRECTVTCPRTSACWSSTLLVSPPMLLPSELSRKPVRVPVRLPAAPAIWPVILSEELSGAPMARSLGAPFTLSGPRETVMPMSAFDSRLLTGLAFCPMSSRGAAASRLARMAVSATATGAIT